MTAGQNLNERTQDKGEFFHLEDRASDHPFVEKVWRCHTDRGDTFLSIAANSFEIVFTQLRGKSWFTLRGPETAATPLDCPAEGEWGRHPLQTGNLHATISPWEPARP